MGLPRPATWRRLTPVVVAVVLLAACAGQAAPRPLPLAPTAIPATAVARTATATAQVVNLDADIQARIAATRRVVFLVPFSHWDTDWHDGYSSYAEQADRNILAAVQLARREPRFRYAFEQVLFVQHFWDTYPQYRADLAALVRTRQLTFAWGGITQPETSLVAPAVQARNLQLGDDWITSTFGIAPPRSAWQSDAFGNAASFPQFLDLSRVPYVFLGRVTNTCPQRPCDNPLPHAFYWSSPVNPQQRVLATYLTYSTALGAVRDKDDAAQQVALRAVIDKETARAGGSKYLFLPFGDDFASPTAALPALVDRWNAANPDTYLVMADPGTAFDYLATQPLPQITADRNPAWQAFYGTRPAAKIADKDSEYLLTAADKFAALLGEEPTAGLTAAWQDAAANAHYDNISGVSFDQVWEESQRPRFARAVAGATGALVGTLARIVGGVAAPLVVFNPTSWSRSGVVELHGDLPPAVLASLPGTVQRVDPQTVAFWAEAVPPVGYAATASLPAHTVAHPATVAQDGPRTTLSNGLVRVTLDAARGGALSTWAAAWLACDTCAMKDEVAAPTYAGYRFPAEVIAHAVWLYFRFALSYRDVEELLAERGVLVTYETIRQWSRKFGQTYANTLRRRRPRPGDKWHLDEVFIAINGEQYYLWRAVDQNGQVLDILVQSRRNKAAAKKFFRRLLKGLQYVPRVLITDKLASYGAAKREVLPSVEHRQHRRLNNRAENSHQPTRERERRMRRFKSPGHAQRFLAAYGPIAGHFRPRRHRLSADAYRQTRAERFATWRAVTGTPAMT